MPRSFAVPNLHLILIHFPIALLILGAGIELFAFLWRRSSARIAARWMILIGAILSVPTAAVGFCDLLRLSQTQELLEPPRTWHELRATSPLNDEAWTTLRNHALITSAAIAVLLLTCVIYIGGSDTLRRRLQLPLLVVVLASVAAISIASWRDVPDTISPHRATARPLDRALSPVDIHVILASLAIPICAIALGLSFRAASHSGADLFVNIHPSQAHYAAAFVPHAAVPTDFDVPRITYHQVPSARYWLLGSLLVIATALAGLWAIAVITDTWSWRAIYDTVVQLDAHQRPEPTRRFAHAVGGAAVVLLPLILALAARFSPRRGFIAAGFGLLLFLAFAATLWTGALLTIDSPEGPLTNLNEPPPPPTTQHAPIELETPEPATHPATKATSAPGAPPVTAPVEYPTDL